MVGNHHNLRVEGVEEDRLAEEETKVAGIIGKEGMVVEEADDRDLDKGLHIYIKKAETDSRRNNYVSLLRWRCTDVQQHGHREKLQH